MVFTLIQKFRYDKGKNYPLLSARDDIVVLVDEAHRTQYAGLAENMRNGLPNANYMAFTGTPLLGRERKTNAWFGDYVSEYNFQQSVEDGATVPLRPCSKDSWYIVCQSPSMARDSLPINTGASNCSTATEKMPPPSLPT